MKYTIVSFHFVDKLQHPISGLHYRVKQSGLLLKQGKTTGDGVLGPFVLFTPETTQKEQSEILSKVTGSKGTFKTQSPDAPLEVFIVTDNNTEKLLHSTPIKWDKRQQVIARSDWVKIPMPLRPDTAGLASEKSARRQSCGFAEVQYEIGYNTNNLATTTVTLCDLPKKIVDIALKYRNSKSWAYGATKVSQSHPALNETITIPENRNKCSLFVYDVLTEAGLSVPWIERGKSTYIPGFKKLYPPLADDWANTAKLKNWAADHTPLPGDVGAYVVNWSDATGHVGIVVAPGVTVSAGQDEVEVNDVGFRVMKMSAKDRALNTSSGINGQHDFTVFRRSKAGK